MPDAETLWPAHEWDGWQAATPMKNLNVGAAGVLWALDRLRERGMAGSRLDLAAAAQSTLAAWRHEPDFMRGEVLPARRESALLTGEAGILLVAWRLTGEPRLADELYALVGAHSNAELLKIDSDVALRQARHWNPIMMNAVLFGRLQKLYDKREALGLTGEQKRLLERTFFRFRRAGAGLDEAAKARMAEINEQLAQLSSTFSHHLLADEQEWTLELGPDDRGGFRQTLSLTVARAGGNAGPASRARGAPAQAVERQAGAACLS